MSASSRFRCISLSSPAQGTGNIATTSDREHQLKDANASGAVLLLAAMACSSSWYVRSVTMVVVTPGICKNNSTPHSSASMEGFRPENSNLHEFAAAQRALVPRVETHGLVEEAAAAQQLAHRLHNARSCSKHEWEVERRFGAVRGGPHLG